MTTSWEQLYKENGDALVLYARQFAAVRDEAEDIVHDAFVRYFEKDLLTDHPNPRALLFQCVRWVAHDRMRKESRRKKREQVSVSLFTSPLTFPITEGKEFAEQISRHLQQLSEEQREVLVLHLWGDLTYREIGEQLGISANTAASRYRYAIEKLRAVAADELRDEIPQDLTIQSVL